MNPVSPCDICARPGETLAISRNLAGHPELLQVCAACARQRGLRFGPTVMPAHSIDLFEVLLDPNGSDQLDARCCPHCGSLFAEVRSTGRVGCVHCFDEFRVGIARLLPRIARRTIHTGAVPDRLNAYRRLFADKHDLTGRLQAALRSEDYESAAGLRDALRDLETGDASP